MPYGPHVVDLVETGLSECFQYHGALDSFVLRAGVVQASLSAARERAKERNKRSMRGFNRAPKRIVVQELLTDLNGGRPDDDRIMAALITGLCSGNFPGATPDGQAAVEALKAQRIVERQEAEARRAEEERRKTERKQKAERALAELAKKRDSFRQSFLTLYELQDPQQRGYALERFLNGFLDFEGLNPRGSFKLIGEQIDGSFSWASRTYLVEAKWVKDPVGANGFGSLMYKIDGKTADTRGLFLSINGYSPEAINGLRLKGELRFICIDGTHLMHTLSPGRDFPKLLDFLLRHASETGEAYLTASSPAFTSWRG
ncbi:MAG TPA: hypothetical protein VKI44_06615 [Acetobacteraceae bacterium]|nr:hypothetical protein [Acetobacteraceae bacterium]